MADNYFEINGNEVIGIHSGSNANGSYVKFSDGTLIQWGHANQGNLAAHSRDGGAITLPISFKDTTYSVTMLFASGAVISASESGTYLLVQKDVDKFSNRYCNNSAWTGVLYTEWTAIGRWK